MEILEIFVVVWITRHGTSEVSVFLSEAEALKQYNNTDISRDGSRKTLYKKRKNSSDCEEIKYEES